MSVTKSSPAASPRKMPRPLGRRPNGMKIDHVLRKAAVLFDKRGYVETTMADLADNLGISKPTLYTIAKGKRQILEAIVETWMNGANEILDEAAMDPNSNERIPKLVLGWATYAWANKAFLKVFLAEEDDLPPAQVRRCRQWSLDAYSRVRSLVADGQANKRLKASIDPSIAALTITAFVTLLPRWYDPKGRMSPSQVASAFLTLLYDGLGDGGTFEGEAPRGAEPTRREVTS